MSSSILISSTSLSLQTCNIYCSGCAFCEPSTGLSGRVQDDEIDSFDSFPGCACAFVPAYVFPSVTNPTTNTTMVSAGWPFFLHYTKTFVKTIPASDNISVEDVLQVLHPPALAGPNSSVTIKSDDVVDPSKPIAYTRTRTKQEVLAVLNLFTITHTVYTIKGVASWTNDGTDMKFETGRGITISQQWRVKQNEESQEVEILMKFDCRH
ncbi:hypothetical protein F5878DRAFT_20967 [Lentinula raphanica]|uniref:Uncharacterized protein n=1 Tax=Lentinula raphanica TaxID=153919 RepID=A0AA38PLD1_9AGAR|nr:hypothetical protein F5878DRAFT_20967 [Lentinula raphanica]